MARYYVCGQVGTGTEADPFRPSLADALPPEAAWAANQLVRNGNLRPYFMVRVPPEVNLATGWNLRIDMDDEGNVVYTRPNGTQYTADTLQLDDKTFRVTRIERAMEFVQDWCETVDADWPYAG